MANRSYRVGVVGLSGISASRTPVEPGEVLRTPLPTSHVSAYAALGQTSVVAVCDLKPGLLDTFKERWGDVFPETQAYSDVTEMIDRGKLDILSVVTPDHAHAEIVVYAANHGVRGIACEKPLATTLADCDRMVAACDANGTHVIDEVCFFAESAPAWVFAESDPGFEEYFAWRGVPVDCSPDVGSEFVDMIPMEYSTPSGVWGFPSEASAEGMAENVEQSAARQADYVVDTIRRLAEMRAPKKR